MDNYGDPLAKMMNDSGGPGGGSGIGSGTGTGIGSGEGGGLGPGSGGGTGGGAYHPGVDGVGYPTCVYCPDPKYSEEARKAKYQGTVVLQAVITPDGRATDIQVVKGPGLGLEEKAVEAVKQWRFKPANGPGGKPVAVVVPHRNHFPFALIFVIYRFWAAVRRLRNLVYCVHSSLRSRQKNEAFLFGAFCTCEIPIAVSLRIDYDLDARCLP